MHGGLASVYKWNCGERRERREGDRERERERERDGGASGEKSAMCLCAWKIGKEANEKAAKSEARRY